MCKQKSGRLEKNKVASGFSKASAQYDQYAVLQQISAAVMAEKIREIHPSLPTGNVLEIGCGTGAVTKVLAVELPKRNILVTDLSPGMVQYCRRNILVADCGHDNMQWAVADGESIPHKADIAFMVSALTVQWFTDLPVAFAALLDILLPGGVLLCSYVSCGSFAQWQQICNQENIPFSANPLPTAEFHKSVIDLSRFEVESWSSDLTVCFATAKDFFQSLQKTGSGTSLVNKKLKASQLRRLIRSWDAETAGGQVEVTYVVSYLIVRKKR